MTEELWKNSAIIAKRNVDSNQTPISVNLTELKQIIDVHSCLVLNQLPDEHYGIDIDGFTEVYDIEDVTTRSYKVDYANGVLYFHPNNIGKMLQVNYYGVGCTLLSASRIYTKYDKYGNVLETLEELLDKGKLYIQAIDSLGGAVEVINRVENANAIGTVLHENLLEDIEIGSELNKDLIDNNHIAENTITTLIQKTETGNQTINNLTDKTNLANQKNQELEVTTSNANNKNTELNNTISTANNTDTKLKDTILSGQDSINKINATGNKSLIIGTSQFVNNQYTWTHNMNNDNLIVNFIDSATSEPLMADYKIIDKNNILIRNSPEHPNIKVILSASYYGGNTAIGTTVEDFLGDSIEITSKNVRLKDNNGVLKNPVTNSDAVFMSDGKTKLTKKINDIDTSLAEKIKKTDVDSLLEHMKEYNFKNFSISSVETLINSRKSKFIAHRGSLNLYPENTNIAFANSLENGFFGFEADIQLTSDNKWVVMHDDTVDRTTTGSGNVKNLSSSQISNFRIDVGSNIGKYDNLKVPFLVDCLKIAKNKQGVACIEIKEGVYTDIQIQDMLNQIENYNLTNNCIIFCFNYNILKQVRKLNERIIVAWNCNLTSGNIETIKSLRPCMISTPKQFVDTSLIAESHKNDVAVISYSINTPQELKEQFDMGVDLFTTDGELM